jgi:hypothetical protein
MKEVKIVAVSSGIWREVHCRAPGKVPLCIWRLGKHDK